MSYQEVLIKSSIMSAEQMSRIIQKSIVGSFFIDSADTVATLRNDFSSDKMIMFGKEIDKKPLAFKKGEQFLVVCGEREAVWSAKYMLPLPLLPSVKVYPIERIMQSEQCINKDYGDVFEDSIVEKIHKKEPVVKLSVRKQLEKNRAVIEEKNKDTDMGERENSQHNKDYLR